MAEAVRKANTGLASNLCLYDADGNPVALQFGGIPVAVVAGGSTPVPMHIEYAYDANQWLQYRGQAVRGSLTSDAAWLVVKYVRDANGNILQELLSPDNSIWDDRTTLTYA